LASTGSGRRALLKAALLAPVAALFARNGMARDYATAAEVFDAIDGLESDVAARLRGFQRSLPASRGLVASVTADHARHRAAREAFRRRLGLPPSSAPAGAAAAVEADLEGLRAAQEALVYAHAEGLPAVGDSFVVDALAHHMVDLSRHLTLTQLWIETES
jgi:hypothetical protein